MAGEPAIDKVLEALRTALAAGFPSALIDIDRPEDDDFGNTEIGNGALNLSHIGTEFAMRSHAETVHRARVQIDFIVAKSSAGINAKRLREMEAKAVETLWANRTLGGTAEDIEIGDSAGDDNVREAVALGTLSVIIQFLTPIGDHRTIIGAAGHIP